MGQLMEDVSFKIKRLGFYIIDNKATMKLFCKQTPWSEFLIGMITLSIEQYRRRNNLV